MSSKPTGYFTGTYDLAELLNPSPGPVLPWFVRLLQFMLGGFGSPSVYLLDPDPLRPLTYYDSAGRCFVITEAFEFDGATTPRIAWIVPGLSPWDWTRAAAFHDFWFFQHKQGNDLVTFGEANRLLGEMVRTLGFAEWKVRLIVWFVNRTGRFWWDAK